MLASIMDPSKSCHGCEQDSGKLPDKSVMGLTAKQIPTRLTSCISSSDEHFQSRKCLMAVLIPVVAFACHQSGSARRRQTSFAMHSSPSWRS